MDGFLDYTKLMVRSGNPHFRGENSKYFYNVNQGLKNKLSVNLDSVSLH